MYRINETLLSKLFLEPNPQPDYPEIQLLFKKMLYRMFPGRHDFIAFLQSQNVDNQYDIAERIIHRLCYMSNFPPPFYALKDVICVESYIRNMTGKEDSYIPRDHFIHLVYLYLLGIYIFFYNREIYIKIVRDNRYERKRTKYLQEQDNYIKDFISEWKYFCLYHDIGYIAELFSNKDKGPDINKLINEINNSSNDFHFSLYGTNIKIQIAYFGTLKIITQLFVSKFVFDNSNEEIDINNKLFNGFNQNNTSLYDSKNKIIKQNFKTILKGKLNGCIRLEKIFSNRCLKYILPTFESKNIIIIGINKLNSEVSFISYENSGERFIIVLNKYIDNPDIDLIKNNPDLLLFDDFSSKYFEFEYLLNKGTVAKKFCDELPFELPYFINAFNYINDTELKMMYLGISSEEHFLNFNFDVYLYLYNHISKYFCGCNKIKVGNANKYNNLLIKMLPQDDLINISDLTNSIYYMLNNKFKDSIEDEFIKVIKNMKLEFVANKTIEEQTVIVIDKMVDEYTKNIISWLNNKEEISDFKFKIETNYLTKIENEYSLFYIFSMIYINMHNIYKKIRNVYSFNFNNCTEIYKSKFRDKNTSKKSVKVLGKSFNEIEANYNIPFNNEYDHGFSSSKYAASAFELYQLSISNNIKKGNTIERKLFDILYCTNSFKKNCDNNEILIHCIDDYKHIIENVLYSIFIHNVYPIYFKEKYELKNMVTKISDPFSYLSLLSDSLQIWNRPKLINPSLFDLLNKVHASEDFNIIVDEDAIYLYEEQSENGSKRLSSIINNLTHLSDVKAIIKKGLY